MIFTEDRRRELRELALQEAADRYGYDAILQSIMAMRKHKANSPGHKKAADKALKLISKVRAETHDVVHVPRLFNFFAAIVLGKKPDKMSTPTYWAQYLETDPPLLKKLKYKKPKPKKAKAKPTSSSADVLATAANLALARGAEIHDIYGKPYFK